MAGKRDALSDSLLLVEFNGLLDAFYDEESQQDDDDREYDVGENLFHILDITIFCIYRNNSQK